MGIRAEEVATLQVDFCGPLPITSRGNRYVFLVLDRFTNWSVMVPTSDATAATAAGILYKHWICSFGCPTTVVADNGSHFSGKDFLGSSSLARIIRRLMERWSGVFENWELHLGYTVIPWIAGTWLYQKCHLR